MTNKIYVDDIFTKSGVGAEFRKVPTSITEEIEEMMSEQYHPLQDIFDECLAQVTSGKGEERHGGGKDFNDQPWRHITDTHGTGFLTGQAEKKLMESQGFEDIDRWEREMFGVIVYTAMSILYRREFEGK